MMKKENFFHNSLGPALGSTEAIRMAKVISQQKYLLTPDFYVKLLLLHKRRMIRSNVILSGETGVGKTEILTLYSLIVNMNTLFIPDIIFDLR
jgi:type IV secretory pathway ATPase VirB11/archaellum biosynthesis ATPase